MSDYSIDACPTITSTLLMKIFVSLQLLQNKCARYWPDETTNHCATYEDLEVRLKRRLTASNKDYITTTFHLAHKQVSDSEIAVQIYVDSLKPATGIMHNANCDSLRSRSFHS